jgi:spermidine/putrescine transport system permease protein
MTILENNGLLNQLFQKIGLIALYNNVPGRDLTFFPMMNTRGAVVLGMVYNYLPFMILPIYSVIIKLDHSLLEAARDLGANSIRTFLRVVLPLSVPGIVSGITMVFIPAITAFTVPALIGNGKYYLYGNEIELAFKTLSGQGDYAVGSTLSIILLICVVVSTIIMNWFDKDQKQGGQMW